LGQYSIWRIGAVPIGGDMLIKQVQVGGMLNFAYIIGDRETGEGLVIDPSWEPERIYEIAKDAGITVRYVVNTHCHKDHVNGNRRMKELAGALIAIHEAESKYLRHFFPPEADIKLKDNDTIKIGKATITVMHMPGHSPGSICLMVENKLFTGDTLFVGGCGRTDLPGGDDSEFLRTLRKIRNLDDDIEVYPGHNYGDIPISTIGREKMNNPCLSL
jgi:glyoxylase-like metal-dependent hydrolase (beta-lactamase superfamily II)